MASMEFVQQLLDPEWVRANSVGNPYRQGGEADFYSRYGLRAHLGRLLVPNGLNVISQEVQMDPTVGQPRIRGTVVSTYSLELDKGVFALLRRRTVDNGRPDVTDPMDLAVFGKVNDLHGVIGEANPLPVVTMAADAFHMDTVPGMRMSQEVFTNEFVPLVNEVLTTSALPKYQPV